MQKVDPLLREMPAQQIRELAARLRLPAAPAL
jgi:hypothetical protein